MSLTRDQFKQLRDKGLSVEQIVAFERGETPADLKRQKQTKEQTVGNQFEQEKSKGFLAKARDFTVGIIGGGKLAQGAGQALAAPKIQDDLSDAQKLNFDMQTNILKKIREKKDSGGDTARLEKALKMAQETASIINDSQIDFVDSLVKPKEVIGSAIRLAGTASGGFLTSQASKALALGKATTFASGALRGAGVGASTGFIEGGIQGAGLAAEQNKGAKEIALSGAIGAGVGAGTGAIIGGITGGISGKLRGSAEIRKQRIELLKTNPDSRVAQYTLTGEGKIATDPIAKEVIKQGMDEGTVATIKGSTATDKIKANEMLDILEKGRTNPTYKALNRPSDVIGNSALERFKVVQTANQKAAKNLDIVANSLRGQRVDPTPAVQSFIDDLQEMGIKVSKGKAVFKGSDIEGIAPAENLINKIVKRMTEVSDDANELHKLKKFIYEQMNYGKAGEGLAGNTERIVKGLASNIDDLLDTNFAKYNAVNTQYSTTRKAIDQFVTSAGAKFNPNSPNANARIGTLARRLLSNAQSRTDVLNALNNLQEVAEKYGGKFSDDIVTQTVFVNDLERLFGTQAPTSLAGEVSKGIQKATSFAGKLKSTTGIFDLALQKSGEVIDKARGINEENLIKAIRQLLQ